MRSAPAERRFRRACCRRCGVALYRAAAGASSRARFALAAVVLVIANSLPIAGLEVTGQHTETTLWGAVQPDQDRVAVAGLVFATTLFAPAVELLLMLYMLVPLRLGRVPRHLSLAFRLAPLAREWGLVDVFMLGVVVSLIKLGNLATVVPGIALWSFGVLILLLTAVGVVRRRNSGCGPPPIVPHRPPRAIAGGQALEPAT
jgi:paraquat-inducible protein A